MEKVNYRWTDVSPLHVGDVVDVVLRQEYPDEGGPVTRHAFFNVATKLHIVDVTSEAVRGWGSDLAYIFVQVQPEGLTEEWPEEERRLMLGQTEGALWLQHYSGTVAVQVDPILRLGTGLHVMLMCPCGTRSEIASFSENPTDYRVYPAHVSVRTLVEHFEKDGWKVHLGGDKTSSYCPSCAAKFSASVESGRISSDHPNKTLPPRTEG